MERATDLGSVAPLVPVLTWTGYLASLLYNQLKLSLMSGGTWGGQPQPHAMPFGLGRQKSTSVWVPLWWVSTGLGVEREKEAVYVLGREADLRGWGHWETDCHRWPACTQVCGDCWAWATAESHVVGHGPDTALGVSVDACGSWYFCGLLESELPSVTMLVCEEYAPSGVMPSWVICGAS